MFNLDKIVMYFAYLLLENNLNLVIIFCCGIMIKNDVFINPSCLIYAKLFVISGHHSVYIGHLSFLDTMYIYVKEIAFLSVLCTKTSCRMSGSLLCSVHGHIFTV